jgi:hypothetical protein
MRNLSLQPLVDAALAAALILLAWSQVGTRRRFRRLLQGAGTGNLEALLLRQQEELAVARGELERLRQEVARLHGRVDGCLQRPRLVRFSAFPDTGADLSFALALTDAGGSGAVISSLYGRDECRVYAKPVSGGRSPYPLTAEERQALAGPAD